MHRTGHTRKNSRIQHAANLGWILEDNVNAAHNKSLQYTHDSHKQHTEPQSSAETDAKGLELRGRALSVGDVPVETK